MISTWAGRNRFRRAIVLVAVTALAALSAFGVLRGSAHLLRDWAPDTGVDEIELQSRLSPVIADVSHHLSLLGTTGANPPAEILDTLSSYRSAAADVLEQLVHGSGSGPSVAEELPEIYDGPDGLEARAAALLTEVDVVLAGATGGANPAISTQGDESFTAARARAIEHAAAVEDMAKVAVARLTTFEDAQTQTAFSEIASTLVVLLLATSLAGTALIVRRRRKVSERAAQGQFDAIFDHAPNPMIVTSCDGIIERVNSAFATALGRPSSDLCGRPVLDFIVPDDRQRFIDEIATPYELLADQTVGRQFVTGDGGVRHMTRALTPLPERRGSTRYLVSYTDVTELRALADETRRIADEHAAVLRALPDAVVVVGDDLSITSSFIPPGFVFPRFDAASEAGMSAYGGEALSKYLIARERSMETDTFAGWVGESTLADGSSRWFEVRVMAIASGGIAVLRDVTEDLAIRQRVLDSEARLRATIDAFPATLLVARRDGTIESFHSSEAQFGDLDLATFVGRSIGDVFGDAHLSDFQRRFSEAVAAGRTVRFDSMYLTRTAHLVHENHLALVDSDTAVVMSLDVTEARGMQHALTEREALLRTLTDSAPIAIGLLDVNGLLLTANPHLEELTGASLAQLAGTGYLDHVHSSDLDHVSVNGAAAIIEGRSYDHSVRVVRTDGQMRWAQIRTAPTLDDDGNPTGAVLTVIDATAEKLLTEQNDQLADVISATSDMVVVTDMLGGIIYANEAAQFFREKGVWFSDMLTPESARMYSFEALPAAQSFGSWTGELLYRNGESPVPVSQLVVVTNDSHGEATSVAHIGRDISDLKAVEARLEHLASHDVLTGLPNRRMCMQRIDHALARLGRTDSAAALIFIDLDGFKDVNDRLGHEAGDMVLTTAAARIEGCVRSSDVVARIGGDEFVVLCEDLPYAGDVVTIASRIVSSLREPMPAVGDSARVGCSIGIAFTTPRHTSEQLLAEADAAMYEAKRAGKGRYHVFGELLPSGAFGESNGGEAMLVPLGLPTGQQDRRA